MNTHKKEKLFAYLFFILFFTLSFAYAGNEKPKNKNTIKRVQTLLEIKKFNYLIEIEKNENKKEVYYLIVSKLQNNLKTF